jgi:hypothetical protein
MDGNCYNCTKDIKIYMRRFTKIYQGYKRRRGERFKLLKEGVFKMEGYGYIKRRAGILPSELEMPTYSHPRSW